MSGESMSTQAAGDPEFAGMEAQIAKSLKDIEQGELVPLHIPASFSPED